MKELGEGIGCGLAGLYGDENVFHGKATDAATIPYQVFTIELAPPPTYSTCTRDVGVQTGFPVRINVFARTYAIAESRVEEIISWFSDKDNTSIGKHKLNRVTIISRATVVDEVREDSAERVWNGEVVFEFLVTKGA